MPDYTNTEDYREAVINAFLQGAINARQKEELLYNSRRHECVG
jgi:hypothetical protein